MTHTKGEWKTDDNILFDDRSGDGFDIYTDLKNGLVPFKIASCTNWDLKWAGGNAKANAKRIVQCVNSHDDLLNACKISLNYLINEYEQNLSVENVIYELQHAIEKSKGTIGTV
jgi:hypothetical protein